MEAVKVVVRIRPLNSSEKTRGNFSIVQIDREFNQVSIMNPKVQVPKTFAFDSVYDETSTQQLLYDETAFPLVESVLQGYNGTIFAYGQTGCGKTFTMAGVATDPELRGIIPNSFSHIFGAIADSPHEKCFLVRCSYSEIYNEEIRDLLHFDPNMKLELKENKDNGIFVKNLSMHVVKNIEDIEDFMNAGNSHRITKETKMNERSSRSHAVFTIYIETSEEIEGRQTVKAGKLNLVDLAGSERQKKTEATGDTLKEAIEINLSLSALGNVISALVDGNSKHIPYRDSKLTRLLQDSLGGNTKTVMIAVCSPADYNYDESLSTLRYASRAKFIQNKPKVNEDPKDALLRQYAEEIEKLKRMLDARQGGEPIIIEKIVEKERIVERERIVEVEVEAKRKPKRKKKGPAKAKLLESDSEEEEYPDDFENSIIADNTHRNNNYSAESLEGTLQTQNSKNKNTKQAKNITKNSQNKSEDRLENQKATNNKPKPKGKSSTAELITQKDEPLPLKIRENSRKNSSQDSKTKPKIQNRKKSIKEETEALQHELEQKERFLQEERGDKEDMEKMIQDIQQQLIAGGEQLDKAEKERLNAQREFRNRIKKQKKREKNLAEENRKKEEEMLMKEKQYINLQEEVDDLRKVIMKLRLKYKSSLAEIEDLNHEHEQEKGSLLETIRSKERETDFLHRVFENMLPKNELQKIRQRSRFDDNNNQWKIPGFVVQQKQITFPKLPKQQLREIVQNELKNRTVAYQNHHEDHNEEEIPNENLRNLKFSDWKENSKSDYEEFNGNGVTYTNAKYENDGRPITSGGHNRDSHQKAYKNPALDPINLKNLTGEGKSTVMGQEFPLVSPVVKGKITTQNKPVLQPLDHRPRMGIDKEIPRKSSKSSLPTY